MALAVLILVAIAAFFVSPLPVKSVYQLGNTEPHDNAYKWIWETVSSAAFWTAGFTAALTWSTYRLWQETRRLAEGAETQAKDNRDAIKAVQRQAAAAEAQVLPYIRITNCTIGFVTDAAYPHVRIDAENRGEGVARNFRWSATVKYWNPKTHGELCETFNDWNLGEIGHSLPKGETHNGEFGIPGMSLNAFVGPDVEESFNLLVNVRIDFTYGSYLPERVSDSANFSGIAVRVKDKKGSRFEVMNDWECELFRAPSFGGDGSGPRLPTQADTEQGADHKPEK